MPRSFTCVKEAGHGPPCVWEGVRVVWCGSMSEILSQLPPEAQKIISVQLTQMRGGLPVGASPIAQKLNSEHITAIIQNNENESVRDFDLAKIGQNTRRIGMAAVIAVITIILVYAGVTKDKDLSEKIIFASISAVGGYGYGKSERRTD